MKAISGIILVCSACWATGVFASQIKYPDPVCRQYVHVMQTVIQYGQKSIPLLAYSSGGGATPQSKATIQFAELALNRMDTGKYTPQELQDWAYQYCETNATSKENSGAQEPEQPQPKTMPLRLWTCSTNDGDATNYIAVGTDQYLLGLLDIPNLGIDPQVLYRVVTQATSSRKAKGTLMNYFGAGMSFAFQTSGTWHRAAQLWSEAQTPGLTGSQQEALGKKIGDLVAKYSIEYTNKNCPAMLAKAKADDAAYRARLASDTGGML